MTLPNLQSNPADAGGAYGPRGVSPSAHGAHTADGGGSHASRNYRLFHIT
jgi:hypothetical protein